MKKVLLALPGLVLLCFGLIARLPFSTLTDSELFPNSIVPLVTLFVVGLVAFLCGCIYGVVLAIKHKRPRWLLLSFACVLAVAVSVFLAALPIVESGLVKPKTGVVLDAQTNKPIAGVFVVARWYQYHALRLNFATEGGGTRCLQRIVIKTDANGRYSIPMQTGNFDVGHGPSIEYKNRYFWGLDVYAPDYEGPSFLGRDYQNTHPSVRWTSFGSTQVLRPIAMTKVKRSADIRANYIADLPFLLNCKYATSDPINFIANIYQEAYPLACEKGGFAAAKSVAELRMNAYPTMPEIADNIRPALQQIIKRYYWNAPLSNDDAQQVCALLKKSNEARP